MIGLRPIRSDSRPNKMKNGVARTIAVADDEVGVAELHAQDVLMKNSAWNWPWYQTTACPAVMPNSASRMSRRLAGSPKLSRHGDVDDLPASLSRVKSGVSCRRRRM